jgi:hypothetical protein
VIDRKSIMIILLIVLAGFFSSEGWGKVLPVKINGMNSAVDLEDILKRDKDKYTESDIKRLCAEITERYHSRGYTAFYIKKAVLDKDGILELFFNESIVVDVIVTGVSHKVEDISSSIYPKMQVFNEFTLKEKIAETKIKFNLKRINVNIKRTEDDQVILLVNAAEIKNEIDLGMYSSPIYGLLPDLEYRFNYGVYHSGAKISFSFNQEERSSGMASVFFTRDVTSDKSNITIQSDFFKRKDSFYETDNLIYEHDSFTPKGGVCFTSGAAGFNFFLTGTFDNLKNYPARDGGVSFTGIEVSLKYNDSAYRIDFEDLTSCGIDFLSGWNFIEDSPSCKVTGTYKINLPLYSGSYISINGNFFYTSDRERFSQFYVFDQYLPCRQGDFAFSSWKNITGADIIFEALKRTLYIGPCVKWGLHDAGNELTSVYAAGMKCFFYTGPVKIGLSYLYDIDENIRAGYFSFSAAGYL